MMRFIKMGFLLSLLIFATACQSTDVIASGASQAFDALLTKTDLEVLDLSDQNAFVLVSPKGDQLLFSKDPQMTEVDLALSLDLMPFMKAGLNPGLLPEHFIVDTEKQRLIIPSNLGDKPYEQAEMKALSELFKNLSKVYPGRIGYHLAMDHYNLTLGGGNGIEWAKDLTTNDKDLVFLLHAQTFVDAGVNPELIEEWTFAAVEMMDDNGKKFMMDKLLKPFSLHP